MCNNTSWFVNANPDNWPTYNFTKLWPQTFSNSKFFNKWMGLRSSSWYFLRISTSIRHSFYFNIRPNIMHMNANVINAPVMEMNFSFCKWVALSTNKTCKLVSSVAVVKCGGNDIAFKLLFKFFLTYVENGMVCNKADTHLLFPYETQNYQLSNVRLCTRMCIFSSPVIVVPSWSVDDKVQIFSLLKCQ